MLPDQIHIAVTDFLALVDEPQPSRDVDARLALLLDQLALASHFTPRDYPDVDVEEPAIDSTGLRQRVEKSFPDYGYFEVAFPFSREPGDTELVVADAIDGMHDIYLELRNIQSLWESAGPEYALAEYRFSYENHWHTHLRELQLYLHARTRVSERTVAA